jgi:hypothetical protein
MTDNPWGNAVTDQMENMAKSLMEPRSLLEPKETHFDAVSNLSSSASIDESLNSKAQDPWALQNNIIYKQDWIAHEQKVSASASHSSNSQTHVAFEEPRETENHKLQNDLIKVTILPEKQGFVFKHVKYQLQHLQTSVFRRYSDFLWLHDFLLKQYPFRTIGNLPPKRIALDGINLEKRRLGLERWINYIYSHPVFIKDKIVNDFVSLKQVDQLDIKK